MRRLIGIGTLFTVAILVLYGMRFYLWWIPSIAHTNIGDQAFYDWYAAVLLLPLLPVITAVAAMSSERRFIFIAPVVVSMVFVPLEWRLFSEMMQPGLWGDAIGATVTPLPGVVPPLAARIPFAAIPALLLAV